MKTITIRDLRQRWPAAEAALKVEPDGHGVNDRPFAISRRDEAVGTVFIFNDLAEVRRDLEATLFVDLRRGVPHQDIDFHD